MLLCSNNMPEMNGDEASKVLREKGYKGIIIGVTGDAMSDDVERFMRSGIDDIIVKPMSSAAFVKCMEKLERKRGDELISNAFVVV